MKCYVMGADLWNRETGDYVRKATKEEQLEYERAKLSVRDTEPPSIEIRETAGSDDDPRETFRLVVVDGYGHAVSEVLESGQLSTFASLSTSEPKQTVLCALAFDLCAELDDAEAFGLVRVLLERFDPKE